MSFGSHLPEEEISKVLDAVRTHVGPIGRPELCSRTGISDRLCRDAISVLVKRGFRIVSDRENGGYEFIDVQTEEGKKKAEIEAARLKSQARELLERARTMESGLEPQRELFA